MTKRDDHLATVSSDLRRPACPGKPDSGPSVVSDDRRVEVGEPPLGAEEAMNPRTADNEVQSVDGMYLPTRHRAIRLAKPRHLDRGRTNSLHVTTIDAQVRTIGAPLKPAKPSHSAA